MVSLYLALVIFIPVYLLPKVWLSLQRLRATSSILPLPKGLFYPA
jgi:hypothetical protein